ncbi:hypothetical protein ABID22_000575 [Pontibacter aydingkolensis]
MPRDIFYRGALKFATFKLYYFISSIVPERVVLPFTSLYM